MDDSEIQERRLQVARQHRAAAHLATQIAMLNFDLAEMILAGKADSILQMRGVISREWMETLGNMLNNVDAADADTIRWVTPIYERAREIFPNAT